jgi:two-component system response regulator DesR
MSTIVKEGRKTIRVAIAEDQGMVLGALAALLEIEGDISVVSRSPNGKLALSAVLAQKPDVFITDIEMPEMTGLDVAAELKRRKTGTRVIILTTFARAGYLRRALDAGASGYLLKDMRAEELAEAVRRVHQGLRVIDPELATEAWKRTRSSDRPRAASASPGRRGHSQRRHCGGVGPFRRHGTQLSLGSYQQIGGGQPGGGGSDCPD